MPSKTSVKSVRSFALPGSLRRLLAAVLAVAMLMFVNTSYLILNRLPDPFGWAAPAAGLPSFPKLFQSMILAHSGMGLLLAAISLAFVGFHLPSVWRRRRPASLVSGIVALVAGLIVVATGLFIFTAAASRDHRWVWWAHVAAATALPMGYLAHRRVSLTRPLPASVRQFLLVAAGAAILIFVGQSFTQLIGRFGASTTVDGNVGSTLRTSNPASFVPTGFVQPEDPFFPSAATTNSGAHIPLTAIVDRDTNWTDALSRDVNRSGFVASKEIGASTCERCHADIVNQWATSAHRFASFNNPFYTATITGLRTTDVESNQWIDHHRQNYALDTSAGTIKSKWCAGCHDPGLLFTGLMTQEVDPLSIPAQSGLTCLACHSIDTIQDRTGNGNYIISEETDPYIFAQAPEGSVRTWLHDAVIKARPSAHRQRMITPGFRESTFCATCHKVSLPQPVNNYRWLRGQNEFDNWHDSGVALNASRTFYLPTSARVCQDCHMPPEPAPLGDVSAKSGTVRSHRFLAANTALPFLRGDEETLSRIETFLADEKLSVDIFAVTAAGVTTMAANASPPSVPVGEPVTVDVVVRNRGVGHTFPGGTNDSNEGWLEVTVLDADGTSLVMSGSLGEDGHLDPMAHVYKAVLLDRSGQPIQRRNAQDIRVTVFANTIGPGTADIAHYSFELPETLIGKTVTIRARLLWRKFDRAYTIFAYQTNPTGFPQFDDVPDLPVTEIARDELQLTIAPNQPDTTRPIDQSEWVRFNDYGIGLLLEGDTRRAALAFERVATIQPARIDGPLNLARTALRDGNVERAYQHLERVEAVAPGDHRAAWVWGVAYQEDGQYEQAVTAYRYVLERFPSDRAAWRNLGRTYYLAGQYDSSLVAFGQVLEIDPEDRIAHYHQMLCYRALGQNDAAERAGAAANYYSIDEAAQEITRAFRLQNAGANLMAQPIRTHVMTLTTQ